MEKINVKELFEEYRKFMDENRNLISGWNLDSSVEEYMEDEGYGQGVVLFLESISTITNEEFYYVKNLTKRHEEYYDTNYQKTVLKRKDGKFFELNYCVEHGEYDEFMLEVKKKTRKQTYYE